MQIYIFLLYCVVFLYFIIFYYISLVIFFINENFRTLNKIRGALYSRTLQLSAVSLNCVAFYANLYIFIFYIIIS